MPRLLGIDLGGTNVKMGILDPGNRIVDSASIPTGAGRGPEVVFNDIAASARRLKGFDKVRACGIGAPGPLDRERTRMLTAPNLGWRNVAIPALLRRRLGLRVALENDANCAALGEYAARRGGTASCFALYTLGTGIGGGLILDGKIWVGSGGGAAEFGHVIIDPAGPRCPCGRRGCLEALASATAVAKSAGTSDAESAFDKARRGDRRARAAVGRAAIALGSGIAGLFSLIQPDQFVISGGMAAAGAGFLATVRKAASERIFPEYQACLKIGAGRLGDNAGWIGAAHVAEARL